MSLSVDVIVAAHNELSQPFAEVTASTEDLTAALVASRGEVESWSLDSLIGGVRGIEKEAPPATEALSLLGTTVGNVGLGFTNLGPMARTAALMIRSSGEGAALGWLGILGPIALVVAAIGGMVAIIKKVEKGWADQAEAAKKAMEEERSAAKARADFLIAQELRIARASGNTRRAWEIEGKARLEQAAKEIQERYEKEVAEMERNAQGQFEAYEYQQQVLAGIRARRDEELNALEAAERAEADAFERGQREKREQEAAQVAADRKRAAEEAARTAAERARAAEEATQTAKDWEAQDRKAAEQQRRQWAESLRDPEGMVHGIEQVMDNIRKALRVSLETGLGQNPAELRQRLADLEQQKQAIRDVWKDAFDFAGPQKAPAYRQLEAFESMTALRAPGVDPMAKQVELSKRMLAELEQVSKNTKPAGGGMWKPAPVYA